MGSFLGFSAVQWQNGSRVAIGVLLLSAIGLVITEYATRQEKWCAAAGPLDLKPELRRARAALACKARARFVGAQPEPACGRTGPLGSSDRQRPGPARWHPSHASKNPQAHRACRRHCQWPAGAAAAPPGTPTTPRPAVLPTSRGGGSYPSPNARRLMASPTHAPPRQWGAITVILVASPLVGSVARTGLERTIGTAAGGVPGGAWAGPQQPLLARAPPHPLLRCLCGTPSIVPRSP